jgi:hypothetical protein
MSVSSFSSFFNYLNVSKPTLLTAVVNSVALGYLYFQKNRILKRLYPQKEKQKAEKTVFQQLINGNYAHCISRKNPIAIVIADDYTNVEEIFQMFHGELFVIRNSDEKTYVDIKNQVEYAVTHLGIKTIFTLAHPSDPIMLRNENLHDEKFDKKYKYTLQDCAQQLLDNIYHSLEIDTSSLKCYYAVYEEKTGNVRFFHYDEIKSSNKYNLKESFVLCDENADLNNSNKISQQ